MGYKTISLSNEAYELLKEQKRENESFSDVILRVFDRKAKTSDFIGAWNDNTPEEQEEIYELLRSMRKETFDKKLLASFQEKENERGEAL
ncbi:MAG: antitoxin VapB family protein [Candidatus Hodarchaeales archaeon]